MIWLFIIGCNPTSSSTLPQQAEVTFRTTVGIPIESRVHLLTKKDRYKHDDSIGIWIENRTDSKLLFKDQSLGLHAYQYNNQNQEWRLILKPIVAADPYAVIVTPGPRSVLPIVFLPGEWIQVAGSIRLVITGTTERGQPFAAYKDIEIVD